MLPTQYLRDNEIDDLQYVCRKKEDVEEKLRQMKLEGEEFLSRRKYSPTRSGYEPVRKVCLTRRRVWLGDSRLHAPFVERQHETNSDKFEMFFAANC